MSKERIGIIGHFGGKETFFDGQTVKTKVFYEELKNRGFDDIFCVDTYYNRKNKIKLLWDTFRCILSCKTIVMILSTNGLRVYLPMMYKVKKFLKRKIYHNVLGGHLHEDMAEWKDAVEHLNSFDSNWVETAYMKGQLEELGVTNCDVFSNFKVLDSKDAVAVPDDEGKFRFCMFSRVMKEKGMTDAIEAVARYNKEHETKVHLDIWGAVEDDYKEEFDKLLETHGEYVTYGGRVDFEKSVSTLTNHVALLFPTHFDGEGCPGTLIDAYAAGLPVISSKWNAAGEMIRDFETGWIYPNDKAGTLYDSIVWAMDNPEYMTAMRTNCKLLAKRYTANFVMGRIIEKYLK